MTHDLDELLSRRAERAPVPPDAGLVTELTRTRANERAGRRRNRLAVASGAAIVVAAGTIGVAVVDSGGAAPQHPRRPVVSAGNASSSSSYRGRISAPNPSEATFPVVVGPLPTSETIRQAVERARAERRAAERARAARRAAERRKHGSGH